MPATILAFSFIFLTLPARRSYSEAHFAGLAVYDGLGRLSRDYVTDGNAWFTAAETAGTA